MLKGKTWQFEIYSLCFFTSSAVSVHVQEFTQNWNPYNPTTFVYLHPGLQDSCGHVYIGTMGCPYCVCECIVRCWCIHTYLTQIPPRHESFHHGWLCSPEREGEAYHLSPHFMPCSRQSSTIEQIQDVDIIDTPSVPHRRHIGEAAGTYLIIIFKRSFRCDILQKCNLYTEAFSG